MNVNWLVSGVAPCCGLDEWTVYAVSRSLGAAGSSPMLTGLMAAAAAPGVAAEKIGVAS
jgi:hypothetical protein